MIRSSKVASVALGVLMSGVGLAGVEEQCYRMHNRVTGVPPTAEALAACVSLVKAGKAEQAALKMTDHGLFYNDTLRYMFSPWTNEDQKKLVDLDDFSATAIGMARDDVDWRQLLQGDIQYTCENSPNTALPPFALENNNHYATCGATEDLKIALVKKEQSVLNPLLADHPSVPAGVYTTRGFASAYYDAGTNRAATRFTLLNFLCEDIDSFHDTSIADFRVRQDIDRVPGGSSKTFVNECKGCHAGMDPLTGAFAYLDWNATEGLLVFTPDEVVAKYFVNNATFPDGFVTTDDEWLNLWNRGANARVGWGAKEGTILKGSGPKSLGKMYAGTEQFPKCMAKTVYRTVCLKDLPLKEKIISDLSAGFVKSGYKMKSLVAKAAVSCMGE
jgi:hypothetical protein